MLSDLDVLGAGFLGFAGRYLSVEVKLYCIGLARVRTQKAAVLEPAVSTSEKDLTDWKD